jgi:hypothetical protein
MSDCVGDRVRYTDFPKAHGGGTIIGLSTTDYNSVLVAWKDAPQSPVKVNKVHLEIVDRAHYAPPGVTMIAMTPERIEALRRADHVLRCLSDDYVGIADEFGLHVGTLDALGEMLAEARGEVKA